MSSALDMSLDDLIKNNKRSGKGGGGGGGSLRGRIRGGSASGPTRRFPNRSANRNTPYSTSKSVQDQTVGGRSSAIETGTKLYISNLDYGVSTDDIKELFSEVGDLKRYTVHYDRSGRSKGMAEVVYSRKADALSAFKRYNNVQLDGKAMKIEIIGMNNATPAVVPLVTNGMLGKPNGVNRRNSGQGRGGGAGRPRGGGSRGRGFGRGRGGRGRGEQVSAEDLDADLEKYHSESMQIN